MKNQVTQAFEQGPREYQEDFFVTKYFDTDLFRGWLLAVMDGHGGDKVAKLCAKEICNLFIPQKNLELSLRDICSKLNELTKNFVEGSTLSIVLVDENKSIAHVAVIGDSPVVIYDGKNFNVSPEHNVRTNLNERELATQRGGTYFGGYLYDKEKNYGLQMSRALGDTYLSSILSREPEIYYVSNPQWLLVSSDGLFDPGHENTKKLIEEIKKHAMKNSNAKDLIEWAKTRGLNDNATVVVWSLK